MQRFLGECFVLGVLQGLARASALPFALPIESRRRDHGLAWPDGRCTQLPTAAATAAAADRPLPLGLSKVAGGGAQQLNPNLHGLVLSAGPDSHVARIPAAVGCPPNKMADEERHCRICFSGERGLADALIEPCDCRGTQALVHVRCGSTTRFDPDGRHFMRHEGS